MTGRISRAIGGGIGLARESFAHNQRKKSSEALAEAKEQAEDAPHNQKDHKDEPDELIWELDDVEAEEAPTSNPFADSKDDNDLMDKFLKMHPAPLVTTKGQLEAPVCIPQRRPRHKTRGFVRAYAPALEGCGIDQGTFMDFLSGFEEAIKMHQVLIAVQPVIKGLDIGLQIASGGNVMIHAASWVLHASVEASRRAYVQYKTNEYLDGMNVKFFGPHGLYALIMCYKPSDSSFDTSDTVNESVARRVDGGGSHLSRKSGTTTSELELPDAAPLFFPGLDAVPDDKKPNVAKRAGVFLGDYYDRRAQARFEYEHPDSKLSVAPAPQFASRYSDPNSAATNSGLIGLVTGGNVTGVRYRIQQRRRKNALEEGRSVPVKSRLITEDVYYLMIVNRPSDAEIAEAKEQLLREQGQ